MPKKERWIDQDHLFTSESMTKLEVLNAEEVRKSINHTKKLKFKPRALRCGIVRWLMKDGKVIEE